MPTTNDVKPEPLMTIEDLSGYLQIPVGTIYKWNSRGTGPAHLKIGRHVRYLRAEVDRWVTNAHPNG